MLYSIILYYDKYMRSKLKKNKERLQILFFGLYLYNDFLTTLIFHLSYEMYLCVYIYICARVSVCIILQKIYRKNKHTLSSRQWPMLASNNVSLIDE